VNKSFVFNQIRRYNSVKTQLHQDAALTAVGIHVGLLEKKKVVFRTLTREERQRVINFLRQFLQDQGVEAEIKEPVSG